MSKKIKKVVILGSTGSIGENTLKVISRYADKFKVVGLTAFNNSKLLTKQINEFSPKAVAVCSKEISKVRENIKSKRIRIFDVETEVSELVAQLDFDIIVIGMSGSAALDPFLRAVRLGKTIAPANKEALVIAGDIIMRDAKKYNAKIIPVDSEQSAIFQCLEGQDRKRLSKVYLTASGGALHNVSRSRFNKLTVSEILKHPRWKMGRKITVDSATLMNKGFEVIEAIRLFDLKVEDIQVVIHPEAIIHSMVSFIDGSILAQLGITDMRLPIQYALTYPERLKTELKDLDFFKLKSLNFFKPDLKKFPSLSLSIYAAKKGGTLPCVLNAADEEAVRAFLNGDIKFSHIYEVVEKVVLKHKVIKNNTLNDVMEADIWARDAAKSVLSMY